MVVKGHAADDPGGQIEQCQAEGVVREMSEASEIHRDIGSLLAQIETLNREMRDIKADVKQLRDDFAAIKGGSRVLLGIAAFLGSGLTWGLSYLFGKH